MSGKRKRPPTIDSLIAEIERQDRLIQKQTRRQKMATLERDELMKEYSALKRKLLQQIEASRPEEKCPETTCHSECVGNRSGDKLSRHQIVARPVLDFMNPQF